MADRFDKFTERARKVLQFAQEEALRLSHNYIGTEHLLLGLLREGEGVAAKVLTNLGVDLDSVRNSVESIIGRGRPSAGGDRGLTPRAKKVFELSVDEARRLNHHYIGTEHLLLGLVREGEGIAAGVLESLGVSLDKVRSQVIYVLNQSADRPLSWASDVPTAHYSEAAHGAFEQAFLAARWYEHSRIDTEHLFVGLVRERRGLAARVLAQLGLDPRRLLAELETFAPDQEVGGASERMVAGYTPLAHAAIDQARIEARQRSQTPVGTGHLLLALLGLPNSHAPELLERVELSAKTVYSALEPRLGEGDAS